MLETILADIDKRREDVIDLQRRLVAIPALGPDNQGEGERAKADFCLEYLKNLGFQDIREYNAPDARVPCGHRPNICAILPGKDPGRTFWVISHIDVVPPGDLSLWESDPYKLVVKDDMIIGRGVEDNHQGLASSVMLAKSLLEGGHVPPMNLGLLLVSDEETGSKYGLDYIAAHHGDIFSPDDLFLVPDFGDFDSEMVEVAEKSMFWLKVIVTGKQCHASTPAEGVNTLVASASMILKIRTLYERFNAQNPLFNPPCSTFEPTKKEANVENINTIPGKDVFYVDCRVLPEYSLDEVLDAIKGFGAEAEKDFGVSVAYQIVQSEQAAPPTSIDSEIVRRLIPAIKAVYDNDPKPIGIGGGTVAAFLRRRDFPAVVWCTCIHNAHQPNERSSIAKTLGDAQVMARVLYA
jgi:succinyl-diaminopimelate desuccinylase